jgi:type IV pilus secretin PilQ/predicted competence protein
MRTMFRPWGLAALLLAGLMGISAAVQAEPGTAVQVRAVVKDGSVRLEAHAAGPFDYSTNRPTDHLLVIDLLGVSAAQSSDAQVLDSDVVSSYRVMQSAPGQTPGVRLEILLRTPVEPKVERQSPDNLTLVFDRPRASVVSSPASAKPSATPVVKSAAVPAHALRLANTVAGVAAIEKILLAQNGSQTEVRVTGNAHLTYHVLHLSDPERLVLDFPGAHLGTSLKSIPSNLDPVREIRASQFSSEIVRVVIDLRSLSPFHVADDGNQVIVSFLPGSSPATEKRPGGRSVAPPVAPKGLKADNEHVAANSRPRTLQPAPVQVAPAPPVILPANLTASSPALARPIPAKLQTSSPSSASPSAPAQSGTPDPVPGNNEVAKPSTPAPSPANSPAVQPAGKYTGEPISVNLKDVDLKDFFRLIHEISGLNVVLDPSVKGTLTIVLDEVPWDQALDLVLRNNGLDKQVDGNVLRIATNATIKKEAELARDLAKAQAEAAEQVTTTRVLSYAKASELKDTLKKFLSVRGEILSDDRSNTLIIRDIPAVIPTLDNLIRQLDKRSQQVEIEARVVAASRSFARDIGSQFAFATSALNGKNIFGGASGVGTSPIVRTSPPLPIPPLVTGGGSGSGTTSSNSSLPLNTNLGASAPTSGVSYMFSSPNFALDYVITAAETKGVAKLLSKPKVVTQNNQKAVVKQGTKIPIQTVVNNTISVQFVDAVLKLEVTPQITADGTVFLDVTVENTQIDDFIQRVNGIPALDTQSTESKVLIADGGTQVIGGIIISSQKTNISQVPIFGSIPLLGNLFRRTTVSTSSQELLFFLTPRILPI